MILVREFNVVSTRNGCWFAGFAAKFANPSIDPSTDPRKNGEPCKSFPGSDTVPMVAAGPVGEVATFTTDPFAAPVNSTIV